MRVAILTVSAVSIVIAAMLGAAVRPPPGAKPIVSLAGSFSAVKNPRVEVISDTGLWETVWKEHMGDRLEKTAHGFDVWPRVDFDRCLVIAMFSGTSSNGAGWIVDSILTRDGHSVIRYDRTGFQTDSFNGEDKGAATTDYGFAVLPRTDLPMILEENTQSLIGRPPIWTERQRLPALAGRQPQRGN